MEKGGLALIYPCYCCSGEDATSTDVNDDADVRPSYPVKVVVAAVLDVVVCLTFFFIGNPEDPGDVDASAAGSVSAEFLDLVVAGALRALFLLGWFLPWFQKVFSEKDQLGSSLAEKAVRYGHTRRLLAVVPIASVAHAAARASVAFILTDDGVG